MLSVLDEIQKLRADRPINIDHRNSNRYRVVCSETEGAKTAYYFSTPVYNVHTRNVVEFKFKPNGNDLRAIGSNTDITVSDTVRFDGLEGCCKIALSQKPIRVSEQEIYCNDYTLCPTTNGIACKASVKESGAFSFEFEVSIPFLNVRANDKYFALMKEKFRPFVTVSCIGTLDSNGQIIAPAKIAYKKINDRTYRLTVFPCKTFGQSVLFEVNLYESKLIQDTTVESRNPQTNNAFGSTAFIGQTDEYGEQWLYSRFDHSYLTDLTDRQICGAILHIPRYDHSSATLSAYSVNAHFCSFGSNWENKVALSDCISHSVTNGSYHSINVLPFITDPLTHHLEQSEGMILRAEKGERTYSTIATGDSFYAPQILEVLFY